MNCDEEGSKQQNLQNYSLIYNNAADKTYCSVPK